MSKKIYLSPPDQTGEELKYINKAIESNWIAPLGPNVDQFESDMRNYLGEGYPVAMSSGTAAIHVALILLGIKPGDHVLCSSLTFVASANPIKYLGANPVFIDSSLSDWNLCPKSLLKCLEDLKSKNILPKALVAVDLLGSPANYKEILEICNRFKVPVIEDSAESLGSIYNDKKCGLYGDLGIFSFNGNKIISTSGGGMLICHSEEHAKKALKLITQARENTHYYLHEEVGYNYRMSNILAGIGIAQLNAIEEKVKRRRKTFDRYRKALSRFDFVNFIPEAEDSRSNRWLTSFYIEKNKFDPDDIIDELGKEDIEARRIWMPLHSQPLFKDCSYYYDQKSQSDLLFEKGLSLPSGFDLTEEQQEKIISIVSKVLDS